jgi:pyruvate kinase
MGKHGGEHVPIIAKIENQEGLEHLEEVAQTADGIMIARGDLGVEIAIEDLPAYQGYIADTCKAYGTPVIYATELLKHMVDHPFPTRAEVSDIYHAVLLGHAALMLSDETAIGQYPLESLEMLGRIALSAEQDVIRSHTDFTAPKDDSYGRDKKYSIRSAHFLVDELQAAGLVIFTNSGYLAKIASAYGPNAPIYAFSPQQTTGPGLNILYGVQSFFLEENKDLASNERAALTILQEK